MNQVVDVSCMTEVYFAVDGTPPTAPESGIRDGVVRDADCMAVSGGAAASWDAFTEDRSTVVEYEWGLGSCAGCTDLRSYTSVGLDRVVQWQPQAALNQTLSSPS